MKAKFTESNKEYIRRQFLQAEIDKYFEDLDGEMEVFDTINHPILGEQYIIRLKTGEGTMVSINDMIVTEE